MIPLLKKEFARDESVRVVKLRGGQGGKVLFFVFLNGAKNPAYCLKMASRQADNSLIEAEFNALKQARNLVGEIAGTLPASIKALSIGGYFISCEEAVWGRQMPKAAGVKELVMVSDWIIELHQAGFVEKKEITKDFLASMINRYRQAIPGFNEEKFPAEKINIFLEGIWPGKALMPLMRQHGDLHFANIFIRGDKLKVVDWGGWSRLNLPFYDLIFFLERQEISAGQRPAAVLLRREVRYPGGNPAGVA